MVDKFKNIICYTDISRTILDPQVPSFKPVFIWPFTGTSFRSLTFLKLPVFHSPSKSLQPFLVHSSLHNHLLLINTKKNK